VPNSGLKIKLQWMFFLLKPECPSFVRNFDLEKVIYFKTKGDIKEDENGIRSSKFIIVMLKQLLGVGTYLGQKF